MAHRFIISGTGPRAGRTTVGCALAFAAKVRGFRVGVMKPAASGCLVRDGLPAADDADALIAAASSALTNDIVTPFRYRSPLAPLEAALADGVPPPDFALIDRALRQIESHSDVVIVEDTHGLATRLDAAHDFANLAIVHNLELILVVARRAGYVDAAIAALDFARRRNVAIRGVILNALAPATLADIDRNADELAHAPGAPLLGTMRFKEPLSLVIVEQLLCD